MASALDPLRDIMPLARKVHADLAARRAGRVDRSTRSKRGATTKQHDAFARDSLLREQVTF